MSLSIRGKDKALRLNTMIDHGQGKHNSSSTIKIAFIKLGQQLFNVSKECLYSA